MPESSCPSVSLNRLLTNLRIDSLNFESESRIDRSQMIAGR